MRGTISLASAALLALGCEPACEVSESPRLYLVASLAVSVPEGRHGGVPGLDLDGRVSDGDGPSCVDVAPDHPSSSRNAIGIDNQLAPLAREVVDRMRMAGASEVDAPFGSATLDLAPLFSRGEMLLAIELAPADASTFLVRVHQVEIEGRVQMLDGRLAPGNALRSIALLAESTRSLADVRTDRCWLFTELGPFAPSGDPTPFPPFDLARFTHLGARVTETGSIADLEVAGDLTPEDWVTWIRRLQPETTERNLERWRSIAGDFVDLGTDHEPPICDRISFGMSATLVQARWASP